MSVLSLTVTNEANADGSNVTIVADIGIQPVTNGGQAMLSIMSTNGLVGQLFQPTNLTFVRFHLPDGLPKESVEHGYCLWTNTSWNPYFTGDYVVTVVAMDLVSGYSATLSTTVTVTRTIGGTVNSVQTPVDTSVAYNANGIFTNICVTQVFLHNIGVMPTNGAVSIPCNLANSTNLVPITNGMTAEQMDMAWMDTAIYRPVGTPFRFDMNLHKRPDSMMGFGDIKRFVWTPVSADAPNGPGRLVLDVISCSPWRNNYTTNLQAHVGFAPLFMTDTVVAAETKGMIMSTTAHYLDAGPDFDSVGIGLKVNGHSNTASSLKAFIPDAMLVRMGVPVDGATKLLAGYVTHFNFNNVSEGDTAAVATEFTRIPGGTNIVYAYNSGTSGDSGFEARLTFAFHSPVAAQIKMNPSVEGDIDGDRYADPWWPMKNNILGMWTFWLSSGGYLPWGPYAMSAPGGYPVRIADFDGDGLADPVMVDNARGWTFWFSSGGYLLWGPYIFAVPGGDPVAGDFDGDRLADPAMVTANGSWTFWFSSGGYLPSGPYIFAVPGGNVTPLAGDFDGDRLADPAMVTANGGWTLWLSSGGYLPSGPYIFSVPGKDPMPMVGDFDGDGLADPAMVVNNNWTFWFSSGGYLPSGPYVFVP